MTKSFNFLFAGFGGQGVLFAGKVTAYAGLIEDKYVSWLPSYGPEMRGGTANCSVCVSDEPIGSPLVLNPDGLVAMNLPSYEKFIDSVVPGGVVIMDSSLIKVKCEREDLSVYYVPATELANKSNLQTLSNIIMLGKLFKATGFAKHESVVEALHKSVPNSKSYLIEPNLKALKIGIEY